jgi:predicted transcriptional regulator of viral defense system
MLKIKYQDYIDYKGKIKREVKDGNLFPIVRGLYETQINTHGIKLAQFIYAPSYLSFDYALYYYDLIPEAIYNTYTCATYNKKKIKTYRNSFGTFIYRDVPNDVFSYDVILIEEDNYSYQIATPEKALCDKLYTISPIKSVIALKKLLFEDLRIDETKFNQLNKETLLELAPLYRSTNLNFLTKLLKGRK